MRRRLGFMLGLLMPVLLLSVSAGSPGHSQDAKTAQQILAEATHRAAEEHKVVFFELGASWCTQCRRLDAFLASPEVAPIVQKYFVRADIHYQENVGRRPELETPGADALAAQFGSPQGVPWFVFYDANGQAIVTSDRPGTGNIGYPDRPEEIDWFMTMLQKSVPAMTPDERTRIDSSLKRASLYH